MTKTKAQNNKMKRAMRTPDPASLKTTTLRGQRKMRAPANGPTTSVVPLPRGFRSKGDNFALRLRASQNIVNTAAGLSSNLLAFTPTSIATAGYEGLADLFPLLLGIGKQYSHFMLTRVVAQLIPTTAVTSGGYVALGYEADDSNTSSPPLTLLDVTSAIHSDVAQVTEIAEIALNVSDYYNDWRPVNGAPATSTVIGQAGVIQLFASNSAAIATGVAIFQLEVDIHFSGYRSTS